MLNFQYNGFVVRVFNDSTYSVDSADNNSCYSRCYFGNAGREFPVSKHGIAVLKNEAEITNCVIIGAGGATGVHEGSAILASNKLLVCCSDTLFCLTLPELSVAWQRQVDAATCFRIFRIEQDFLIHGELSISRIDLNGNIKWSFGGADIFVSIDSNEELEIHSDFILATDYGQTQYRLDFNGNLLWSS
ncbi:MAG: hypothetical protein JWR44_2468 [Hymenobacter sp.]|jgi:hypothetical protein|nr:hypothetical protein [Hymenobacter sp.]